MKFLINTNHLERLLISILGVFCLVIVFTNFSSLKLFLAFYNNHGAVLGISDTSSLFKSSKRLKIGTAVSTKNLESAQYSKLLKQNFNLIVPEFEMKWSFVEPSKNVYDFSKLDKLVNYAVQNGMEFHGHTLIWYKNTPKWVEDYIESLPLPQRRAALISILRDYITTVVSRYKGKVASWDVVNEAIVSLDSQKIGKNMPFRKDSILQKYIPDRNRDGVPEYIELSFKFARAADPQAKLFYNDYNIEYLNPHGVFAPKETKFWEVKSKSENTYKMVQAMQKSKIPIDGVGIQGHIVDPTALDNSLYNKDNIAEYPLFQTLQKYDMMGIETRISEMDVRLFAQKPNLPDYKGLFQQAVTYSNYLTSCNLTPTCKSFSVWQFSDNFVWYGPDFPGSREEYYPNLFTRDWKPKLAYIALLENLEESINPATF